jgi:hypothetical protein
MLVRSDPQGGLLDFPESTFFQEIQLDYSPYVRLQYKSKRSGRLGTMVCLSKIPPSDRELQMFDSVTMNGERRSENSRKMVRSGRSNHNIL